MGTKRKVFLIIICFSVLLMLTMTLSQHATVNVSAQSSITWHTASQEAMQIATAQNKSVMIFFYSDNCPWCTKQKATFSDERVIEKSKDFVPLMGTEVLARQYHIRGIPVIVFANSQGEELYRITGYRDADTLLEELQRASEPYNQPQAAQSQSPGFHLVAVMGALFVCWHWCRRRYAKR
ncbi:MAG: thioredoxin fold domain-containing protein [Euryarchaeota archaeon]|nr:thioredoxin fold domain-containing protein [Euryarchaeota archaeon]